MHSNASNPFRKVQIYIRMLQIPIEWFEFTFERFESLSNGSNLDLNASNPFGMVRIYIRMFRIPFEWLEFGFECFKSHLNFHSNTSNLVRMIRIGILTQ